MDENAKITLNQINPTIDGVPTTPELALIALTYIWKYFAFFLMNAQSVEKPNDCHIKLEIITPKTRL